MRVGGVPVVVLRSSYQFMAIGHVLYFGAAWNYFSIRRCVENQKALAIRFGCSISVSTAHCARFPWIQNLVELLASGSSDLCRAA